MAFLEDLSAGTVDWGLAWNIGIALMLVGFSVLAVARMWRRPM